MTAAALGAAGVGYIGFVTEAGFITTTGTAVPL
jgi:hypothetical protein